MQHWHVAGVSLPGFAHQMRGAPCEDAKFIRVLGPWFVGVVSDGAGSARHGSVGAERLCARVGRAISFFLKAHNSRAKPADLNLSQLRTCVEAAIKRVRQNIEQRCSGVAPAYAASSLADFHATLIGVVASAAGGVFFHIGDGVGVATQRDDMLSCIVSHPETGEYSNETFFFSQPNWKAHLRFKEFGPEFDLIFLMTDGVMPFAMNGDNSTPYIPFFQPVTDFLATHSQNVGELALTNTLGKEELRKVTDDDKTLVWALRSDSDGTVASS